PRSSRLRAFAVDRPHDGLDATAHGEVSDHLDPPGCGRYHEIVQDTVCHVLVERAFVAIGPDVQLEGFELYKVLVGDVTDADGSKVRLAGPGADAAELRDLEAHLVVAVGMRVRNDFDLLRRSCRHQRTLARRCDDGAWGVAREGCAWRRA